MSKEVYPTRTFALTLRTTETIIGVPAEKRLARALKAMWRVYGLKCVSVVEVKEKGELSNAKEEK
jgi:hypothetical protein